MTVPLKKSLTVALTVSVLSVIAIISTFKKTRSKRVVHSDGDVTDKDYPDDIKNELTSRVQTFFGSNGFKSVENSFVVVVGLGGVGSHCANMLVRSGVRKIRLIDFDQVTLSSLNRHALANMHDVGTSKADALRRQLLKVVPWCEIEAVVQMFKGADADKLLQGEPDFVLDCIDDVHTKAELIAYCLERKLPVITSMGAGGKSDPTRMRVAALSDCINDPLASKIKWKLKKHHGVSADDVLCVFSAEKPKVDLLPLDEDQRQSPQDYGAVDYLRLRIMPVLGTSPSIFGQAMASFVLCTLAGKPYEPEVCERMSRNLKHKVLQFLKKNESQRFGDDRSLDVDDSDIEFVVQEVWKSRCASTGRRFGGHVCLTLTRWDASRPPAPDNLVLLMHGEAQRLAEKGHSAFRPEVVQRITSRLAWASGVIAAEEATSAEQTTVVTRVGPVCSSKSRTAIVVTGAFVAGASVGLFCRFW